LDPIDFKTLHQLFKKPNIDLKQIHLYNSSIEGGVFPSSTFNNNNNNNNHNNASIVENNNNNKELWDREDLVVSKEKEIEDQEEEEEEQQQQEEEEQDPIIHYKRSNRKSKRMISRHSVQELIKKYNSINHLSSSNLLANVGGPGGSNNIYSKLIQRVDNLNQSCDEILEYIQENRDRIPRPLLLNLMSLFNESTFIETFASPKIESQYHGGNSVISNSNSNDNFLNSSNSNSNNSSNEYNINEDDQIEEYNTNHNDEVDLKSSLSSLSLSESSISSSDEDNGNNNNSSNIEKDNYYKLYEQQLIQQQIQNEQAYNFQKTKEQNVNEQQQPQPQQQEQPQIYESKNVITICENVPIEYSVNNNNNSNNSNNNNNNNNNNYNNYNNYNSNNNNNSKIKPPLANQFDQEQSCQTKAFTLSPKHASIGLKMGDVNNTFPNSRESSVMKPLSLDLRRYSRDLIPSKIST